MRFLLLLFLLSVLNISQAQKRKVDSTHNRVEPTNVFNKAYRMSADTSQRIIGLVEKKSEKIDLLIQDFTENKKSVGFRIQIFSSNNRAEAMRSKADFANLYPSIKSYIDYQAPNFKVRIGNYNDRLKIHADLESIKQNFTSAFIVKCEIEPEL